MTHDDRLDCVVIGYNETPFEEYESLLRRYGEDSEAYRDLKFNFVDIGGRKLNYVGLLNDAFHAAHAADDITERADEFKSGDIPNLAAVYLTNFLRRRGLQAKYINLFQYEKATLIDYLAADPVCVAITTTFYVINMPVVEMVELIRQYNKRVQIVVGGPLVSNHYRQYQGEQLISALDDIGADIYVTESQGEQTLTQVIETLKAGADLGQVPNLIYRDRRAIHPYRGYSVTVPARENNDLDENIIDWTKFDDTDLGPTIQTRTARSCAFSCAFCGYPGRAGKLTLASLDAIEKELDSIHRLGYVKNVVFIDDTFNVPLDRFKLICRLMIRKKYGFNWFSYFRCGNSDEEAVALMAESGCKGVFLGIESGSPKVLKAMHKAATIEKYQKGIELLRKNGIMTFASFITGFPTEDDDSVQETIDFIKQNRPDFYRTMLWYCEPGTPIYARRDEYGVVGEGFKWRHDTMDSTEAMDYIDQIFLSVAEDESLWLPQWSLDFWFIPYILGKGISLEQFKAFMRHANRLLALEIASVVPRQKEQRQQAHLQAMIEAVGSWYHTSGRPHRL